MHKSLIAAVAFALAGAAQAQAPAASDCDRACMSGLADRFIASVIKHKPGDAPMAPSYRATENGIPAGIAFMTPWRTVTGTGSRQYFIDTVSHHMVFVVTVKEGPSASLLWGRLKVADRKVSEAEIYLTRSRADAGFIFSETGIDHMPEPWTAKVDRSRLPSREELTNYGRSMFDHAYKLPQGGPDCALLENGGVVKEEPEWMKYMMGGMPMPGAPPPGAGGPPKAPAAKGSQSQTMVGAGCPLLPIMPVDPRARLNVVDTDLGVVVSIATLEGLVYPYPVTTPTWSAFVPKAMQTMHSGILKKALASGKYREPMMETMPASIQVAYVWRVYDGKLQGWNMLEKLGPTGAVGVWAPEQPAAVPGEALGMLPAAIQPLVKDVFSQCADDIKSVCPGTAGPQVVICLTGAAKEKLSGNCNAALAKLPTPQSMGVDVNRVQGAPGSAPPMPGGPPPGMPAMGSAPAPSGPAATPEDARPFLGDWSTSLDMPMGPMAFNFSVRVEGGQVLAVVKNEMMGESKVTRITREDGGLMLSYEANIMGNPAPTTLKLTNKAPDLQADFTFMDGAFGLGGVAKRQ